MSSRKMVPPWASSNLPFLSRMAPVKEPRTCPKSSLSSRVSEREPQLILTKGPFLAVGVLVDIMGQHGLAGARFPGDQHRGHGVGDGVHQFQELVHLPVPEHQGLIQAPGLEPLFQGVVRSPQLFLFQGVADGEFEAQIVDGLGDVVVGPQLDGLHGAGDVAVAGNENDRRIGSAAFQLLQQLEAVESGHLNIGEDQLIAVRP